jgi:hypothetical protein
VAEALAQLREECPPNSGRSLSLPEDKDLIPRANFVPEGFNIPKARAHLPESYVTKLLFCDSCSSKEFLPAGAMKARVMGHAISLLTGSPHEKEEEFGKALNLTWFFCTYFNFSFKAEYRG